MANWVKIVLYTCLAISTGIGNGGLLFLLIKNPVLHRKSNFFIGGLAATDILLCVSAPLSIAQDYIRDNPTFCIITSGITLLQVLTSCLFLVAIAVERYIAIVHPLHYYNWVMGKRIKWSIAVLCIYAFIICFVPTLSGWNAFKYRADHNLTWKGPNGCHMLRTLTGSFLGFIKFGHIYPSMVVMVVIYSRIFYEIYQQNIKMQAQIGVSGHGHHRLLRERRGVITLVILVNYFILSWLPITIVYLHIFQWFSVEAVTDFNVPLEVNYPLLVLALSNSAVNPFIYGFSNPEVRKALRAQLSGCCCDKHKDFSRRAVYLSTVKADGNTNTINGNIATHPENEMTHL